MKTKNIFLLTSFAAYLYLFYHQSPGINFLIFSALLVISFGIIQPVLHKNRNWLIAAGGVMFSGIGMVLYGNTLSLVANVLSLLVLGGFSFFKEYSLVFALFQSILSYLFKPFITLNTIFTILAEGEKENIRGVAKFFTAKHVLRIFLPLLVVLVFTLFYSKSNPLFSTFLENVAREFSIEFITFAITGFILIYVYFNQHYISEIQNYDMQHGNVIAAFNPEERSVFQTVDNEFAASKLTFLLLNLLLFLVNALDAAYIFDPNREFVKHTVLVHESVNNSISSVLVAILVVLYFFRGNLNLISQNKTLKVLAVVWIFQNLLLLVSCFYKNLDYIYEQGLTHKRIGVYAYLLVVLIALLFSWYKISRQKSNMFLIRVNSWSLFILLSASTCVNWNKLILDYNRNYHPEVKEKYYLEYLDYSALTYLYPKWSNAEIDCEKDPKSCKLKNRVLSLHAKFEEEFKSKSWQSWIWDEQRIYNAVSNR